MSSSGTTEIKRLQCAEAFGSKSGQGKNEHRFFTTESPPLSMSLLLPVAAYIVDIVSFL
jgi:hypothetical protein